MRWRRWLRPLVSRNGSPEAIARGIAIGLVIAFTPTIGFQILLAYLAATFLKASRAAAILPIWVTTPVTVPAIYAFTYKVGTWFVGGPSVSHVRGQLWALVRRPDGEVSLSFAGRLRDAMALGFDIILPMTIGGLLVGACCAAAAYPGTLWAVRRLRSWREQRKQHARRRFHLQLLRKRSRPSGHGAL